MWRGTREDRSTIKSLVIFGFKPQPPAWQANTLSIALCPSGPCTIKLCGSVATEKINGSVTFLHKLSTKATEKLLWTNFVRREFSSKLTEKIYGSVNNGSVKVL